MSSWPDLPSGVRRAVSTTFHGFSSVEDALRRIVGAVTDGEGPPGAPEPTLFLPTTALGEALEGASLASPDAVESVALGALDAGKLPSEVLNWAARGREATGARAAAVTAVLRDAGYEPVMRWAGGDDDRAVRVVEPPPGLDPDLFAVPRRVATLGGAIARRFATDFPETALAIRGALAARDADLFRPEVIPALARERGLMAALGEASDERFERVILPLSRVPGVNVLVLAGLLVHELLDPMEVLSWIGADINALPRRGVPYRPEDLVPLDPPRPGGGEEAAARYMIFSDVHREPEIDRDFRIDHFAHNRELYLRALEWCDERGYTVLENGDCEELWFEPTFDPARRLSKRDRLERIVAAHQGVYDLLARLADQGRYLRSIGNHDSYLWEDADVRAWLQANPFPEIHGGFVLPKVKTMDDLWPHVGLDPDAYADRQSMLVLHGHQLDFWNCDEHNRLGKFIANAVGVLADALDDLIYDWRGVDRLGHPLVEFWDVLAPLSPFDNWPPREIARTWAEAIEQREPVANVTQDSIMFSETFAAVMAILMRSGEFSPFNFHVLLCIGHTHNPQSRPWIPYLDRFNPWREQEIAGIRAFERLFAIKTRYLNSGTVGWWDGLIWAIEVTEAGQPRLVYWSEEDLEPVPMDWELQDGPPLPASPLAGLADWAAEHLRTDAAAALGQLADTSAQPAAAESPALASVREMVAAGHPPDEGTLARLLSPVGAAGPSLRAVERALSALGALDDPLRLATTLLAARGEPVLRGTDPRSLPRRLAQSRPPVASPGLAPLLWPRLVSAAADPILRDGFDADGLDPASVVRTLYRAFTPSREDLGS